MNNSFVLDSEIAYTLSCADEVDGYELITQDVVGEWRWGNVYRLVFKDHEDKLWEFTYKEQSGDHYWCSIDPSETKSVTCFAVKAVEVVTTEYVRIENDANA